MPDDFDSIYHDREQTLVKHEFLKQYLLPFALVIGMTRRSITYVDTFSGPWNSRANDLSDTSFAIAIQQLKTACRQIGSMGRATPRLRAFFTERDKHAFQQLDNWLRNISGIEVERRNADYSECISEICDFVAADPGTFPFFLIDPTGWKLPLDTIAPLLQHNPGEAIVMLMTEHVRRFITDKRAHVRQTFDEMFGVGSVYQRFESLQSLDRDDAILQLYMTQLQQAGKFDYASSVQILHGVKNRTHFHLIYLTRHRVGVEKFKDAERKAMEAMEKARADAESRSAKAPTLFANEEPPPSRHYEMLRKRSLMQMQERVDELLATSDVSFDTVWADCMKLPLVWPQDVSEEILQRFRDKRIIIDGLKPRQRSLKPGQSLIIRAFNE